VVGVDLVERHHPDRRRLDDGTGRTRAVGHDAHLVDCRQWIIGRLVVPERRRRADLDPVEHELQECVRLFRGRAE